jgi:hypothetical protein
VPFWELVTTLAVPVWWLGTPRRTHHLTVLQWTNTWLRELGEVYLYCTT